MVVTNFIMDDIQCMKDIEFTKIIEKAPVNDSKISGGRFRNSDINVVFEICPIEKQILNFKVWFKSHPAIYPFCVQIDVIIQDKNDTFYFIKTENLKNESLKCFTSKFTKDDLKANVKIIYKLHQIPTYVSRFENKGCLCYFNSVIQILFHLSIFGSLIRSGLYSKYIEEMNNLFTNMNTVNSTYSTLELAKSFGWPENIAIKLQQDASEFLLFVLKTVLSAIKTRHNTFKKNRFDNYFVSQFRIIDTSKEPNQVLPNIEESLMIMTDATKGPLLKNVLPYALKKDDNLIQRFERFPQVLFIQVNAELGDFEKELDLSEFSYDKTNTNCKYKLSGFIIRDALKNNVNSGHFKCFVRSEYEDLWYYFNDTSYGIYDTTRNDVQLVCKEIEKNRNTITGVNEKEIHQKILFESRIRVLMYVKEDFKEAFIPDQLKIPPKGIHLQKNKDKITKCLFKIITNKNLIEHINKGKNDFKNIEFEISFELKSDDKKSDLYKKVSEELKMPIDSFILKESDKRFGRAPSGLTIENIDKEFEDFESTDSYLFCFDVDKTSNIQRGSLGGSELSIPFIFLYYEFNPNKFLRHLHNNLDAAKLIINKTNQAISHQVAHVVTPEIVNILKKTKEQEIINENKVDDDVADDDDDEDENKVDDQGYKKNNFGYLTTLFLSPNSKLSSVVPQLLSKMNKKNDTKICFYMNKSDIHEENSKKEDDDNDKYSPFKYVKTDVDINTFNNQNIGRFIYVQCLDETTETKDAIIDKKFLFFKYKEEALGIKTNPKTLPVSFLMEKFSVPVTFVKLGDHLKPQKTMLVPFRSGIGSLQDLNRIICKVMNEEYKKENLMQLFLSFRKETTPFTEPVTSLDAFRRALQYNLDNIEIKPKTLEISRQTTPSSALNSESTSNSIENLIEEPEEDNDYNSNQYLIHVYYKIFDGDCIQNNEKSYRFYFSEDGVKVNFTSQFLMKTSEKVEHVVKNLFTLFPKKYFSGQDIEKINQEIDLITEREKNPSNDSSVHFLNNYRILKVCKNKISNVLSLNYFPGSNVSIRIERIPSYVNDPNYVGFVPVYYGARYKDKQLIIPFGDPFLFPIYEDELDEFDDLFFFKESDTYNRLIQFTNLDQFEIVNHFVTNYDGVIQNTQIFDFKKLLIEKDKKSNDYQLYIAIVLDSYHQKLHIDATSFLDEEKFFNDKAYNILNYSNV